MSNILLITSKSCQYCPMAREFLKQKNVDFTEIDIGSNNFEYLKQELINNGINLRYVPAIIRKNGYRLELIDEKQI